jgi:hypothetical protein
MKHLNRITNLRNPLKPLLVLCGVINRFFHRCKFETIYIPHSNIKGEIWIQQCKCGEKREVLFDSHSRCRQIKLL